MNERLCSYQPFDIFRAGVVSFAIGTLCSAVVVLLVTEFATWIIEKADVSFQLTSDMRFLVLAAVVTGVFVYYLVRGFALKLSRVKFEERSTILKRPLLPELLIEPDQVRQIRVMKPKLTWFGLSLIDKEARVVSLVYRKRPTKLGVVTLKVADATAVDDILKPFRNKVVILEQL